MLCEKSRPVYSAVQHRDTLQDPSSKPASRNGTLPSLPLRVAGSVMVHVDGTQRCGKSGLTSKRVETFFVRCSAAPDVVDLLKSSTLNQHGHIGPTRGSMGDSREPNRKASTKSSSLPEIAHSWARTQRAQYSLNKEYALNYNYKGLSIMI